MAAFLQRLKEKNDVWAEAKSGVTHLAELYPTLHAVLSGQAPEGKDPGRLPGSVRLFSNGGTLKFVITGREWLFDVYGVVGEALNVFEEIDRALADEKVSYKVVSEQKAPKTPY